MQETEKPDSPKDEAECKYTMDRESYRKKISTPSQNPAYFGEFIAPLIAEAREKEGRQDVRIVDIACGHANELEHIEGLENPESLHMTGLDLSAESIEIARKSFAETHPKLDAKFVVGDAEDPHEAIPSNSYDVGIAVNAMAYKPGHILKALYNALKPGGKCSVNFMIPGKNPMYLDYFTSRGCILRKRVLKVTCNGKEEIFTLLVTDFSDYPDPHLQALGQQAFFQSEEDLEKLMTHIGFRVVDHKPFYFASVANPNNDFDIYTLEKPTEIESASSDVRENILATMNS